MQDQQILNATITIEAVVDKGKKLSIKGNDGSRVSTYSVWKSKQDGSDSQTYAQFKTMDLGVGSTVYVGYVIDEFTTNINGLDKRVQSKKIINFRETNEVPSQSSQRPESPRIGQNNASSEVIKDSLFYERLAYEKCCSLWAQGMSEDAALDRIQSGKFYQLFQAIKADGTKRFSGAPLVGANLIPVVHVDDDLVEGIPF